MPERGAGAHGVPAGALQAVGRAVRASGPHWLNFQRFCRLDGILNIPMRARWGAFVRAWLEAGWAARRSSRP